MSCRLYDYYNNNYNSQAMTTSILPRVKNDNNCSFTEIEITNQPKKPTKRFAVSYQSHNFQFVWIPKMFFSPSFTIDYYYYYYRFHNNDICSGPILNLDFRRILFLLSKFEILNNPNVILFFIYDLLYIVTLSLKCKSKLLIKQSINGKRLWFFISAD